MYKYIIIAVLIIFIVLVLWIILYKARFKKLTYKYNLLLVEKEHINKQNKRLIDLLKIKGETDEEIQKQLNSINSVATAINVLRNNKN